jgi:hypothetical protein
VALVALGCAVAGIFVSGFNPNFQQSAIMLIGSVFAVISVLTAKNHSEDDLSKAVAQLQGSAMTVLGYFLVIPTSTAGKIGLIVGALLSMYAVWRIPNANTTYAQPPVPPAA